MSTFNFDPGEKIHVKRTDDEVIIRFDGDTLGFNTTSDGFSITNDWNNRYFTLSFDKDSILYHITREDIDDRKSGKGNISPEEFIAEIYGYIRSLAHPTPIDQLDVDFVGKFDMDEARAYVEDYGVIHESEHDLQVDIEKKAELITELNESGAARGNFYQRILNPVSTEKAMDKGSGENIYAYPTKDEIRIFFLFPDGYVGVTTGHDVVNFATMAGGSQVIDHLLRSISSR